MRLPDAQKREQWLDRLVVQFVDRPFTCCCSCCWLLILLMAVSIAAGYMNVADQRDGAWSILDGEATQNAMAVSLAREAATADDGRRLALRRLNSTEAAAKEAAEQRVSLFLFYKGDVAGAETVFTPARLQEMCLLERHWLTRVDAIQVELFDSAVALFYGAAGDPKLRQLPTSGNWTCDLLSEESVAATVGAVARDVAAAGAKSPYGRFIHPDFAATNRSAYTRSYVLLRAEEAKKPQVATVVLEYLGRRNGFFQDGLFHSSAFIGDEDRFVQKGAVRVRVVSTGSDEFATMVQPDFLLAFLSIVIVWVLMWIYLGSLFVSSMAMFQILASLPVGALFYRILQIDYFAFLHILVIYLVLGIGADDIFVLFDTFSNIGASAAPLRKEGRYPREALCLVVRKTWARAAGSIFNTSLTTAMAFLSCSGSRAMPMRTCGWYAAIVIMLNYVFTITFTPAYMIIWHQYLQGARLTRRQWHRMRPEGEVTKLAQEKVEGMISVDEKAQAAKSVDEKAQAAKSVDEKADGAGSADEVRIEGASSAHDEVGAAEVEERPPPLGCVNVFLERLYIPAMEKRVGPVRPVPILLTLTMLGVACQGAYHTSQLTPPRTEEVWFPESHMLMHVSEFVGRNFNTPAYDGYTVVEFVWGVRGVDISDIDVYYPAEKPGRVVFQEGFDLSTPEAQQFMLDTCERIKTLPCNLQGCDNTGYGTLMLQSDSAADSCFLRDFKAWNNGTLPTHKDFLPRLIAFRATANAGDYTGEVLKSEVDYKKDIGIVGGELKFAVVKMRTAMASAAPFARGQEVADLLGAFAAERSAAAPPALGGVLFVGGRTFAGYDLSQELLSGLFSGCAIAVPIAFAVLLVSTRNIILSLYAVFSVGAIVLCVLGFCKSEMDWDLGIGEAIAGVIVIGYSVDYVVHLAHIYCEARHAGIQKREERAAFAVRNMGSTVLAGALTTAGSGAVMFFCFFYFFFKMAVLICVTIMYSFMFSLGFFMPLVWLIGPQGDAGDLGACIRLTRPMRVTPSDAPSAVLPPAGSAP